MQANFIHERKESITIIYFWEDEHHILNYYDELCTSIKILYYHRGEDFGAVPDRHDFRAVSNSKVTTLPPPEGDGASNGITLHDCLLAYRNAHANSSSIRGESTGGGPGHFKVCVRVE